MNPFMKEAIEEARKGIHGHEGGPFGSVVVRDGQIIGRGHNQVLAAHDPTCHGEVQAIRDACKNLGTHDLSGCELYTTAEPCPMCLGAILWANLDKVYFGCNVLDTDGIGFRDEVFYKRFEQKGRDGLVQELDREACQKLFEEYSSLQDNVIY